MNSHALITMYYSQLDLNSRLLMQYYKGVEESGLVASKGSFKKLP